MTPNTKPSKPWKQHLKRILLGAIAGGALGAVCGLLPPTYQAPCSAAAKIIAVLFGR